jgi:FlaA1/EpsC-like NDP-sugar epimerase
VVPIFRRQIAAGGPLTVTDPEMTRYFMTIPEAVQLIIRSGSLRATPDGVPVYVLDMGEPVRIVDLVSAYAAQLGVRDYEIEFTGLRPGEKLHEALVSTRESCVTTTHDRVSAARPRPIPADFGLRLARIYRAADRNDAEATRSLLRDAIPEYEPMPVAVIPHAREVDLVAARPVEPEPR